MFVTILASCQKFPEPIFCDMIDLIASLVWASLRFKNSVLIMTRMSEFGLRQTSVGTNKWSVTEAQITGNNGNKWSLT